MKDNHTFFINLTGLHNEYGERRAHCSAAEKKCEPIPSYGSMEQNDSCVGGEKSGQVLDLS